jgi:Bardet-Biedl syndrome 5 protein
VRDSKFGRALVVETFAKAGGYILGFRVDPQDRINEVFKEISSYFQIYSVAPIFGVEHSLEAEAAPIDQVLQAKVEEDVELVDDLEDTHAVAAYYAESAVDDTSKFEAIQYDGRLGLAVEGLVDGITLDQLWRVV